jgi:hypothetical protein
MSFSTDDDNEYDELAHLFAPTEQAKPTGIFRGRDEAEDCRNETIDEGQSRVQTLIDAHTTGRDVQRSV